MPPVDLSPITAARADLAAQAASLQRAADALAAVERELAAAKRAGRTDAVLEKKGERQRAELERLRRERDAARTNVKAASDLLVGAVDGAELVETLDAKVPIALLPVRLETRFGDAGRRLRVRIFPDDLHVAAHRAPLTAREADRARGYWEQRWSTADDPAAPARLWATLTAGKDALRLAYAARRLTPTNVDRLGEPGGPSFPEVGLAAERAIVPPQATALPDRFAVIGYRGGQRLFVKWGKHVPDALDLWLDQLARPDEAPADGLPITPSMRWLTDYAEAEGVGMAVTVTDADLPAGQSLAAGLDRLVAVGVDWTLAPDDAGKRLGELLASHVLETGLELVRPGTPTNNTGAARTRDADPAALAAGLDPARGASAPDAAGRLAQALGLGASADPLDPRALLERSRGAELAEARTAGLMINVLWSAVPGYFTRNFFEKDLSDDTLVLLRKHATLHLRPGGPLPAIRVGQQPYGILPVVASARFRPEQSTGLEAGLHRALAVLRQFHWGPGQRDVPRMGRPRPEGPDIDKDLEEVLQQTPLSSAVQFRPTLGPLERANAHITREEEAVWKVQQAMWDILFQVNHGVEASARRSSMNLGNDDVSRPDYLLSPDPIPLEVPFVQEGPITDETPWKERFLDAIAAAATAGSAGDRQLRARSDGASLLEALVAQAAYEEQHHPRSAIVAKFLGLDLNEIPRLALTTPELFGFGAKKAGVAQVSTSSQLANLVIPAVTGGRMIADHLADALKSPGFLADPTTQQLVEFISDLRKLAERSVAEVDRAFRGALDTFAFRLDAWFTSLATRRLAALRASRPTGLHLGAYGWVEDLKPDQAPDSMGYVLAPSPHHAITASLLRSGHLSHEGDDGAFAIDLSSDRVRLGLHLLSGVGKGQPLAALLGYRFERGLRQRGLEFGRFILPVRRRCPLLPSTAVATGEPQESIGARDVVDGLALVHLHRSDPAALSLHLATVNPAPSPSELEGVLAEVARLEQAFDAVADLSLAEAVHQLVAGNLARSGAALAALDRQEIPLDPEVVRTPRRGDAFTQRLLLLWRTAALPAPYAGFPTDDRGRAEPRLNSWAAHLLGDPGRIAVAGTIRRKDGGDAEEVACSLAELGWSPLSLVLAAAGEEPERATALEARIAARLWAKSAGDGLERTLTLREQAPAGAEVGLGELSVLLRWARQLVLGRRHVDGRDLTPTGELPRPGLDVAELERRANAAAAAETAALALFEEALARDGAGATLPELTLARLREAQAAGDEGAVAAAATALEGLAGRLGRALEAAASLGVKGAAPRVVVPGNFQPGAAELGDMVAALAEQAAVVGAALTAAIARRVRLEKAFAERAPAAGADASSEALPRAEHQLARLRSVLGEHFPVMPLFTAEAGVQAAASRADEAALLRGDPTRVAGWLVEMSATRPAAADLDRALTASELLGGLPGARDLSVFQLPHAQGQSWAALPADGDRSGITPGAVAVAAVGDYEMDAPCAGLLIDAWHETVPSPTETAAVAFHYDAPGARAPQAVLLAVPPDQQLPHWSFDDLLDTVLEAADLARLRLVGPKQMRGPAHVLFPAALLPDSFSKDVVPSFRWRKLAKAELAAKANVSLVAGR
jgi:hypothetical protein